MTRYAGVRIVRPAWFAKMSAKGHVKQLSKVHVSCVVVLDVPSVCIDSGLLWSSVVCVHVSCDDGGECNLGRHVHDILV